MDASTHPSSAAGRLRSARLALPGVGAGRLILEAEFGEPPLEQPPTDPLARLTQRRRPALYELTRSIRSAATDRRVVALIAHLGTGRLPLATAAELRAAVTQFRASGKPTVVWTETFGEGRPATAAYYLASAFAEIWLQPSGELGLAGLATQPLFFAGLLERIGISVEMDARHEYKSAAEPFTRTGLSPAARQAGEALLRSAFATVTSAVAADRGLGEPAVRAAAGG
jgi:protease-4